MLLLNIMGARLPEELVEQIENYLVPPAIPSWPNVPKHTLLYLDVSTMKAMLEGPLVITAQTRAERREARTARQGSLPEMKAGQDEVLSVYNPGRWDVVEQVINGFFS